MRCGRSGLTYNGSILKWLRRHSDEMHACFRAGTKKSDQTWSQLLDWRDAQGPDWANHVFDGLMGRYLVTEELKT